MNKLIQSKREKKHILLSSAQIADCSSTKFGQRYRTGNTSYQSLVFRLTQGEELFAKNLRNV